MQQSRHSSSAPADSGPLPNAERYNQALQRKLERALVGTKIGRRGPVMIGRFTVERTLGRGGNGDVYFGRDERLGREVAIKLLRAHTDPISQARFERGAKALALLAHANVVQLHEIGDVDGVPFIVMEYIDGGTLKDWIAAEPRSLPELVSTYIEAGKGLAAAHDSGFVHRDFKPSNVMLSRDGRVLVTDFGLARRPELECDDLSRELRVAGMLTGTPAYMAPEQFAGADPDPRSDQFSFCVALWEAIYGQRPYYGVNIPALVTNMHSSQPQVSVGVRVPRKLRRALERGLAIDADARWPSLEALLDALRSGTSRWPWRVLGRGNRAPTGS